MINHFTWRRLSWLLVLPAVLAGCQASNPPSELSVPAPVDRLLAESVHLGPWLRMDPSLPGVEVMVQARDSFGHFTKAFGTYRFEVYSYQPREQDHRGRQLAVWDVPLLDPRENVLHWEDIHRAYRFRLRWDAKPSGPCVMVLYFDSPFTPRLTDQRVFGSEGLR